MNEPTTQIAGRGTRRWLALLLSWLALAYTPVALGQGSPDVPRAPADVVPQLRPTEAVPSVSGRVKLVAMLTDDGQRIDQGLVWRVFDMPSGGKPKLISTNREPSPEIKLDPGTYVINVAFGRAHLTRRIVVKAGGPVATERFVLNAGGLKLDAVLASGEPLAPAGVQYDILSDERDQLGNRARIMTGARPGIIIRLNSGIYHVVSTYGDANATVQSDVTVEAGKLTNAVVSHAAARVTFKLVAAAGGHALADTQWQLQTPAGEPVKESVGALPTHILAPGTYTVIARSGGQSFRRDFAVKAGDVVQVEVVMQ